MITKTQYNYICTTKSGLTKTLNLMVGSSIVLWDLSMGQSFITIEDAEMHMCREYKEVTLDTKAVTTITKIEKPIGYFMTVGGQEPIIWCQCQGVYENDGIICPKCNNPMP